MSGLSAVALALGLLLPALASAQLTKAAAAEAAGVVTGKGAPLVTLRDKTSYATGVMTARNLLKNDIAFDVDLLIAGLRDGLAAGDIRMSEKELKGVLLGMQTEMQRHLSNDLKVKSTINRERGVVFQNAYRDKPGVQVLAGNLMVRPITEGTGERPTDLGTVTVKYRGTLVDGTEFDATPEGKTATLKLENVITGWREALKRMPAGSTWEIVVPPALAYGIRGAGPIGPNETLVFTVELVAVVK
ncbi:MAG: FKBP-type peptidyl-prolyl cis-trans isomerase [Leptothrix sp. (in: b-proteobacteria)]